MAYTSGVFWIDYANGSDATRDTLSGVVFDNPSGTTVRGTKTSHGLTTGAIIDVTGTTNGNGAYKVTKVNDDTFTLDDTLWSAFTGADVTGDVVPRGGTQIDPWKTLTSGATAARIQPGDELRFAKSPAPTSLGVNGTWTNAPASTSASNITSSTDATPIVVTKANHGLSTNDIVHVAEHTTNTNANGLYPVNVLDANTFELVGSVGNGTGGATGTFTKVNHQTVVLASAGNSLCVDVNKCDAAWTGANSATSALVTSDGKAGQGCTRVTAPASPATGTLYGYIATGALDLSGCQKITFWVKNEVAVAENNWSLCLCSDTAGATVVDTIAIPAIPSTGSWIPLTIARTGGGNLGSSIQSVALYSGSVAPTGSKYIYLDNILATTTDGLNLQSLISKNSAEQGGTEPWLALQSIHPFPAQSKTVCRIANLNTDKFNSAALRGYSGTTETVETYKREACRAAQTTANLHTTAESGTSALPNVCSGGWDLSTGLQDGETIIDGMNGTQFGLYAVNNYWTFSRIGFVRVARALVGFSFGTTFEDCRAISCVSAGGWARDYLNATFIRVHVVNSSYGFINTGGYLSLYDCSAIGSSSSGVQNTGRCRSDIRGFVSKNSGTSDLLGGGSYGVMRNLTLSSSNMYSSMADYSDNRFIIEDLNGDGNHWAFADGGTINNADTDRSGGSGYMWVLTPASLRVETYPLYLPVARIALVADEARTITLYMKKSHATNVGGALVIPGGQLAGIASDVVDTKADDADTWEQLSVTVTPTETGVVEVYARAYYVSGTGTVSIDDLGVS